VSNLLLMSGKAFDPIRDSEVCRRAMKSWGCDDGGSEICKHACKQVLSPYFLHPLSPSPEILIHTLCNRTTEELQVRQVHSCCCTDVSGANMFAKPHNTLTTDVRTSAGMHSRY
jgi:hypothetical protein